jgi:hypothetical protein
MVVSQHGGLQNHSKCILLIGGTNGLAKFEKRPRRYVPQYDGYDSMGHFTENDWYSYSCPQEKTVWWYALTYRRVYLKKLCDRDVFWKSVNTSEPVPSCSPQL